MEEPAVMDSMATTTVLPAMATPEVQWPAVANQQESMAMTGDSGPSTVATEAAAAERDEASEMKATRTPEEPAAQQPQAPTPPAEQELSPSQTLAKKTSPPVQQQSQAVNATPLG